jgi:hypothetical protein
MSGSTAVRLAIDIKRDGALPDDMSMTYSRMGGSAAHVAEGIEFFRAIAENAARHDRSGLYVIH